MIAPGLRFGRYEVGDRIGKGGFGVVHFARDTELGRDLAIKFLRREYQAKPKVVQRFLQEARAAARIGHPGIVMVFECGEIAGTGLRADGTAFIAMELLKGDSLADRIAKYGRLPLELAIAIARQIASALGAAHSAGIIHRDLKPDNVHLIADPAIRGGLRIKILDFGVAKLAEADAGVHTHSQVILGTPRYMPPEQSRSAARADHRSDIYALGCILYELVCGHPPYGGDIGDVIAKHQSAPIPSPRTIVASTPLALDRLISAMLAKAPEDRPPTMMDVDAALERCQSDLPFDAGDERTIRDPMPPLLPPAPDVPTTPFGRKLEVQTHAGLAESTPTERGSLPLPPPAPTPFSGTPTVRDLRPMIPPRKPAPVFPAGTAAHDQPTMIPVVRGPITSEVTTVRPPRERSRFWQFLVILAGLTLGAFVSLILLAPDDDPKSARTRVVVPPTIPPPPPPPILVDAPLADAPVADAPVEPVANMDTITIECMQQQARQMWGDLLICAEKLAAFDEKRAHEYRTRAVEETRSEPRILRFEQALKDGDLERAKAEFDQIWPESVSFEKLKREYARAETAAIAHVVRRLKLAKNDCNAFNKIIEQERASKPARVAEEAQRQVQCTQSSPAPATPKCNAAVLAQQAEEQWTSTDREGAFKSIEAAVQCRAEPVYVQKALVLACNMHNLPKARTYWKRLNPDARQQTLTICVRNGITEDRLNAP